MLRVLVVNHADGTRPAAAQILETHGFLVDIASDGADAIDHLRQASYEAMILDIIMPRVDGHGVLVHLSRTNPIMIGRTILVASGAHEAAEGQLDSVCRVLLKPIMPAALLDAVYECLPSETT